MVARLWLLLGLLVWLVPKTAIGADASLRLEVSTARPEYGRPIRLELFASGLQAELATLDLSALQQDFVVETPELIARDSEAATQHWRVRLYPRRAGELRIPPLQLEHSTTDPVQLQVDPARDRKDDAPILVDSDISATAVWINQAVRVEMRIDSADPHVRLETDSVQQHGLAVAPLPHTTETLVENGIPRVRHRIGWTLHPQTAGTMVIQLPPVRYQRDGVVTHRFHPPAITLQVRPLPAFVPPTMPVGRMQLEVTLPDRPFLLQSELAFLTLRISGEGLAEPQHRAVLRQLKSDADATFYPPREIPDQAAARTGNQRSYQVPFAPQSTGLLSLPTLRLQYFDPATGRIHTHTQPLGRFLSLNRWQLYAGWFVIALGFYRLSKAAYRFARRRYRTYRAYRTALQRLQQANTPSELKQGLMAIAGAEGWPTNLTVAGWLARWVGRYPELASISAIILQLQARLYGHSDATLDEIRAPLVDVCYRRMPLLRITATIQ